MYSKQTLIDTFPNILSDPKAAAAFFSEAEKCLRILIPTSSKTAGLYKQHFGSYGTADDYEDLIQSCLLALWENAVNGKIAATDKIDGYISAIARNQLLVMIYQNTKPTSSALTFELEEECSSSAYEDTDIDTSILEAVEDFHTDVEKYNYNKEVSQFSTDFCYISSYKNAFEASKKTGVAVSSISRCVRHQRKTAGGYIWLYSDDKICELMKFD